MMGVSRQHFYDIKKGYDNGGMPALQEKFRRRPNLKNRVAPEIEAKVVRTAEEYPAWTTASCQRTAQRRGADSPNAKDNFEFFRTIRYQRSWNNA